MKALGGERKYSSYSLSTSALDGSEWLASRSGRALAPQKEAAVPIVQEAGHRGYRKNPFASAGDRISLDRSKVEERIFMKKLRTWRAVES
jgi:hypothetical protein